MPDLPTFTVSQATADRLLAAFANQTLPDGTALTPVQAYKRWHREALISHVNLLEGQIQAASLQAQIPLA